MSSYSSFSMDINSNENNKASQQTKLRFAPASRRYGSL